MARSLLLECVSVCFALVHHANHYLITDGYDNREGISDIVGSETDGTGILAVLAVHESLLGVAPRHIEKESAARSTEKRFELTASSGTLAARYRLPRTLKKISIECGLSPYYLALLRHGSEIVTPIHTLTGHGFSANGTSIILETPPGMTWTTPEQECIGHGRTVRVEETAPEFELRLRVETTRLWKRLPDAF